MNLARKISFSTSKEKSGSTPQKKTSFSFSGSLSRTFSQTRGSSIGRAADEIIDSDGRRLIHIDSKSSSFKVVDNLSSCYISVKLVLPDGHEIPKEKVRGETPSGGASPEINATLGNFYKLTPGGLPKVVVQLKKKNLASHSTVGVAEFDLEEINDEIDDKKDIADSAQQQASEADSSVLSARAYATEAMSKLEQVNKKLQEVALKRANKATTPGAAAEGGGGQEGGGGFTADEEAELAQLKVESTKATKELENAKHAVTKAEAYAEMASNDSRKAATEAECAIERKIYLSQAAPSEASNLRGSSFLGSAGSNSLESGGQPIGHIVFSIYFSGGDDTVAGGGGGGKKGHRLSFVGETEDDEEEEESSRGKSFREPTKSPNDLPPGCPCIEVRKNDYEGEEYLPNEVEVIIISGTGLRAMDDKTLLNRNPKSDPFVKVAIGKKTAKTKTIKQTLEPQWHTRLTLPAPDIDKSITFSVYDSDFGGVSNDFMGCADIPLKGLFDKKTIRRTLILKNKDGLEEEIPFGKIDVIVKWRFNQDLPMNLEVAENAMDDEEDDDEDIPDADDTEEGKAKAEEDLKAALDAVDDTKVISGDYMLSVHIIEARELKAKDDCGTSDPVVYIEAFGKKVNTAIIPKTLNPVFDDSFTISIRNLDSDEFSESILKIQVYDADSLTRNDLIGSYILDAMYVYQQKNHELWQVWVGLVNEQDPTDDGLQGYLKLSISIVGPNDKPVLHKDGENDKGAGKANGKDLGSLVLMPPTIRTVTKWLVITVHFAEYLPKMDSAGLLSSAGIDAYYTVVFGDRKPFKSKVVKVKAASRDLMNPVFNQELWIPVTFPAMSAKIKHGVWDHDWGPDPDDLVTEFSTDIKFLEKYLNKGHKKLGPSWMNLYGASVCKDPNAMANALGSFVGTSDAGKWATKYNKHPEKGSTYRGRILISQSIREKPPEKDGPKPNKQGGFDAFKRKAKRLKMAQEPPSCLYRLRACVMSGVELPKKFTKLMVIISIGKYEIKTPGVANQNGSSEWYFKSDIEIELPTDLNSIPDCFIHLCKYDKSQPMPFCFARMKPNELFSDGSDGQPSIWPEFKWITLQEDKSLDALPGRMFPGALLLKLGLSKTEIDEKYTAKMWDKFDLKKYRKKTPFCIRVHVFMGSDLPAADDNGLLDPYLRIGFGACKRMESRKQYDTRDPLFLATFDFNTTLCDDLSVAPPVCLHLYDYDWGPDADDFCGITFAPMNDAFIQLDPKRGLDEDKIEQLNLPSSINVIQPSDEEDNLPGIFEGHMPKWYPLMFETKGDGTGELLVSVQIIPCGPDFSTSDIPPKPNVTPPTRPAFMEIVALGCRGLLPYKLLPMSLVHLKFTLDTSVGPISNCTSDSKKPTPNDPNFLERIVVPIDLPKNPIFCPALRIAAYDTRLGGAMIPNIGNCRVDLRSKCPWSDNYIPPRQVLVKEVLAEVAGPLLGGGDEGGEGGDKTTGQEKKIKEDGEEEDGDEEDGVNLADVAGLQRPSEDSPQNESVGFSTGVAADGVEVREMTDAVNRLETVDSTEILAQRNYKSDGDVDEEEGTIELNENFDAMLTKPPKDLDNDIKLAIGYGEDDGTGVFGDLGRLDVKWKQFQRQVEIRDAKKEAASNWFGGGNNDLLNEDEETESQIEAAENAMREQKYLADRIDCQGATLEEYLMGEEEGYTAPFEKYAFTRGQPKGSSFAAKDKDRSVGFFKGMIRIVEFDPTDKSSSGGKKGNEMIANLPLVSEKTVEEVEMEQVDLIDLSADIMSTTTDANAAVATAVVPSVATAIDNDEEEGDDKEQDLEGFEGGGGGEEVEEDVEVEEELVVKKPKKKEEPIVEQVADLYDFSQLLGKPKSYKVRLYVMRGIGLAAMDEGWGGRPGKSDPYIKASIGKSVYNNRANYIEDSVDPDFFECIELDAELPGAPLVVEVMDRDDWTADDLIGRTVIDLEDRWFDEKWHSLGQDSMCSDPGKVRWKTKPVEVRPLHIPAQQQPQGHLELWGDLLDPAEALKFPCDDIALPPPMPFQVRVIVWKAKDVVSMDSLTNMNDTYARVGIHGVKDQSTDIHWRAKKGKASWNYRLKFDLMLGLKTPSYKFPYLKFQMWDKDILKYDDLIAETMIDMSFYFKKALRQVQDPNKKFNTIKVFEDPPKLSKDAFKETPPPQGELSGELQDTIIPGDGKFRHLFEAKHVMNELGKSMNQLAHAANEVTGKQTFSDFVEQNDEENGLDQYGNPIMTSYSKKDADDDEYANMPGALPSSALSDMESGHEIRLSGGGGGGRGSEQGVEMMSMNRNSESQIKHRKHSTNLQTRSLSSSDSASSSSKLKKKNWFHKIEGMLFEEELQEEEENSEYGSDTQSLLGDNDDEEEEEDKKEGEEEPPPKRRRRKKKKETGNGVGCSCCLRCLCRGCCTVLTCSCFAPSEPQLDADGKKIPKPPPHLLLRTIPSLFGEGTCKRKCPTFAALLRFICLIANLLLAIALVIGRIVLAIFIMALRCVVQFFCECCINCFPCLACCMPEEDKSNDDDWEDVPEGEEDEADAEEEAEEAKQLANQLASLVGRGPDPPDSGWLKMDRQHPKKPEAREPMGKLCVSIEIYTKEAAEMKPGGQGRRKPNTNPRMPPPTGRLKWSWNPFVMGSQLCGPKLCCYFTCFLLTGVFIVLSIYCQPFVNVMMWLTVNLLLPG